MRVIAIMFAVPAALAIYFACSLGAAIESFFTGERFTLPGG